MNFRLCVTVTMVIVAVTVCGFAANALRDAAAAQLKSALEHHSKYEIKIKLPNEIPMKYQSINNI